jgi:hypothetical protein
MLFTPLIDWRIPLSINKKWLKKSRMKRVMIPAGAGRRLGRRAGEILCRTGVWRI